MLYINDQTDELIWQIAIYSGDTSLDGLNNINSLRYYFEVTSDVEDDLVDKDFEQNDNIMIL